MIVALWEFSEDEMHQQEELMFLVSAEEAHPYCHVHLSPPRVSGDSDRAKRCRRVNRQLADGEGLRGQFEDDCREYAHYVIGVSSDDTLAWYFYRLAFLVNPELLTKREHNSPVWENRYSEGDELC